MNRNTKERISLKKTKYMRTAIQNEWLRTASQKQEGQIMSTKKMLKSERIRVLLMAQNRTTESKS